MKKVLGFVKEKSKLLMAIAVSLVVGGSMTGFVLAAIPDGSGVIHACYRPNNGSLRIIDSASATCTGSEVALNWNQTGPQGPPGAQGEVGPPGAGKTMKVVIEGQEYGPVVTFDNVSTSFFDEQLQRRVDIVPTTNSTAVMGSPLGVVVYTSNDCTGTPYVGINNGGMADKNLFYNNLFSLGYDKHFIVDYNEPAVAINTHSRHVYSPSPDPQQDTLICESDSNNGVVSLPLSSVTMPLNTAIVNPLHFVYN